MLILSNQCTYVELLGFNVFEHQKVDTANKSQTIFKNPVSV